MTNLRETLGVEIDVDIIVSTEWVHTDNTLKREIQARVIELSDGFAELASKDERLMELLKASKLVGKVPGVHHSTDLDVE